ncbi:hypothetical protein P691DRAFT_39536 [Macrolepiota fuliginosa MF-IS2]|uniref:MYND-type domain-containing protein n=1 Tax=Macrolepiota fuliginosa MF-IS2 TaxID=1400762 RepID=A0A9P5XBT8_9AGAR|nr:hypothetical protein P691DRAFT_39536 [Macrolepiota fuliginosa MF-IS2]
MTFNQNMQQKMHGIARAVENGYGRNLEQLIAANDILSGAESQRLRTFCTSEYMVPSRDLDDLGRALYLGDLSSIEEDFNSRLTECSKSTDPARDVASLACESTKRVCDDFYKLRWGPTQVPIFNLLGLFRIIQPDHKDLYFNIARFFIKKGLPVDGKDLSGTTALSHSFSTKPGFDFEYSQLLYDAGGDVNDRNRYGGIVAHEILQVFPFSESDAKRMAVASLKWFLAHGGNIDIADSDGMVPRYMCEKFQSVMPELLKAVRKEDQRRKSLEGTCCTLCGTQNPKLLICSRCKKARYCPRDQKQCQRLDWPQHKKSCRAPAP